MATKKTELYSSLCARTTPSHIEMLRSSQRLTQHIKELADRYETPMPILTKEVSPLEDKVNNHLAIIGFSF